MVPTVPSIAAIIPCRNTTDANTQSHTGCRGFVVLRKRSGGGGLFLNGNKLYEYCRTPDGTALNGACFGYIMGVAGATDQKPGFFCLPKGASGKQIEDVVKLYLQNHPENRHYSGSSTVIVALKEKFPCN